MATLGPATSTSFMIERLVRAGMDIARLNLSHGTLEQHARFIQLIRTLNRRLERNVAILLDLPGPKYRVGTIKNGQAELKKGTVITLTTEDIEGDSRILPINLPNLPNDVKQGDTILLADGALRCRVQKTQGQEITCRVTAGGIIETGKGIVVPRRHISEPFLTEAMQNDILFAVQQQPEFIALSFVSTADDVVQTREILRYENTFFPVIAKIERVEAVRNFDSILKVSDAIMVARGDLGVEIPLEKVPSVQKEIIHKCNKAGKPVITATEMLESMITTPRPTRAEVTDVANAIYDGTDAVMLSGETAVGKYPVQTVSMMGKIAREADRSLPYERILKERSDWVAKETDELISYNACLTALRLQAAAIVAYTQSGSTARRVSRFRPGVPILALTSSDETYGQLVLCRGVFPVKVPLPSTVDNMFAAAINLTKEFGLAKKGDLIVITAGIPAGQPGTTNVLKVEKVE